MRHLLFTALLCALLAPVASAAPSPAREQVEQFARARAEDGRQLLLGPIRPHDAPPAGMDCAELYLQRLALTRAQLDYRTAFWDDPRHQAGVFLGAIWTPAFYYLPFRAVADFLDRSREPQIQADIDALRARSAQLRCYER